ncbi:MAG: pyridoxal phosphate-dependent aminotransferase [Methylobacteriaceae bacterium]|jgi:cystathionine beta-lyase|nr:pyridoxal phosphate-dependent aminotransferase [Methylobacteriaceae bacterium]
MTVQHNFDEIIDRSATDSSKWRKYPKDVLPMWVADSDFRCPRPVVDAVTRVAADGVYGYPFADDDAFNRATARWMSRRFGWDIDQSLVDYVPSLGTALAVAVKAFTQKGDNVLMQTPIYPPFGDVTKYNERHTVRSSLVWRDGRYHIDFDDFERLAADPKTKLFLLCNPHNPTGRVFTVGELRRMGDICLKHNVTIFSDEIHCDYVFPGARHVPLPTVSPEIARITVVGINPSKTFNIAGMRTAAAISCAAETRAAFRKALLSCKLGRSLFGTLAYVTAYNECDDYADQVCRYVEGNIDYAVSFLNEKVRKIKTYKPEATFLLWLDCRGLGLTQPELEAFFLEKAKVGLNTGTSFGLEGEGFMRLNTACPRATLEEGLRRLEQAVAAL